MDNSSSGMMDHSTSPPPSSPSLVYASQTHLNNASNGSVSTAQTGATIGFTSATSGNGVTQTGATPYNTIVNSSLHSSVDSPPSNSRHQPQSDSRHQPQSDSRHQPQFDSRHQPQSDSRHQPQSDSRHQLQSDSSHQPHSDSRHQPRSKVGVYGWRKRCLYLLLLVIFVVAILNLALIVWVIRVIGLSANGIGGRLGSTLNIGAKSVRISGDAEFLGAIHTAEVRGGGGGGAEAPLVVEAAEELSLRVEKEHSNHLNENSNSNHKHANDALKDACSTNVALKRDRIDVSAEDLWVKNCAGETIFRAGKDAGGGGGGIEIGGVTGSSGGLKIVGEGGATFVDGVQTSRISAPTTISGSTTSGLLYIEMCIGCLCSVV